MVRRALVQALEDFGVARATRLGTAIVDVVRFADRYGGPSKAQFAHAEISVGLHGVGHAVRTMVWASWLASEATNVSAAVREACLAGAMIHDTGRRTEWIDAGHGDWSADHSGHLVAAIVPDPDLLARTLRAVRLHSCDDADAAPADRDTFWQILKDADGLDRCRLGRPGRGGCNVAYLRDPAIRDESIAWVAYRLVPVVTDGQWVGDPCRQFAEAVRAIVSDSETHSPDTASARALARVLETDLPAHS